MAGIQSDSQPNGKYEYGKVGAHSRRRILHVGDATGQAITNGLVAAFKMYPNINILTNTTAVDLITFPHHSSNPLEAKKSIVSNGVYAFDSWERIIHWYISAATALATGGLGRRYRNTSNPPRAPGDGLAMAHRAGARIISAEYIQFHPTSLALPGVSAKPCGVKERSCWRR
jgi:L-aspartate oxidase